VDEVAADQKYLATVGVEGEAVLAPSNQTQRLADTPPMVIESMKVKWPYRCAEAGISPVVIENQASYLAGWLK
jgi:hypothetical protein